METSVKSEPDEEFVDSCDSLLSDDWQDLSKSDYAKVIFCYLYHHPESGGVGCKFQITDNVHEDPCDSIGLFRVGYDNLSQCLVSKMLSNTECEEDGKLFRCVFSSEELPDLEDGFYQFLYITRDQEVCGASMPFEIKRAQPKEETSSSDDDVLSTKSEDGFIVVQLALEKKNQLLEALLEKYRVEINSLATHRDKIVQEKDSIISNLNQEILTLKNKQLSLTCGEAFIQEKLKQSESENSSLKDERTKLQESVTDLTTKLLHEYFLKNKILKERDEAINLANSEGSILVGQLEDQKFMIKALEDSKQLALKEMNDLSEALLKRNKVLNQTRHELADCKSKLEEYAADVERQTAKISALEMELLDLTTRKEELIKENKTLVLMNTKREQQSVNRTGKELLQEGLSRVNELHTFICKLIDSTNFKDEEERNYFFEIKTVLLIMTSKMRKPKPETNERKPGPVYYDSPKRSAIPSRSSYCSVSMEEFALKFALRHAKSISEAKKQTERLCIRLEKFEAKRFNILNAEEFQNLCPADVEFVNKLTEKIIENKNFPTISYKDDNFATESTDGASLLVKHEKEKIPSPSLKSHMIRLENVVNVVKGYMNNNKDWKKVIKGCNLVNGVISDETHAEIVLTECKLRYQLEILFTYIIKQEKSAQQTWEKLKDLELKNMDMEGSLKLEKEANAETIEKLKEENLKKDAVIEHFSSEKVDLLLKQEEAVMNINKEHAARIQEAAELYKKQYLEIQQLKKKIRLLQRSAAKTCSKLTGYASSSTADDSSSKGLEKSSSKRQRKTSLRPSEKSTKAIEIKFLPLRAEVIASLKKNMTSEIKTTSAPSVGNTEKETQSNISSATASTPVPPSDSDTGEHVLTPFSSKETDSVKSEEIPVQLIEELEVSEAVSNFPCPESTELKSLQQFFSEEVTVVKTLTSLEEPEKVFIIPCTICDKPCTITATNQLEVMDHLKNEHEIDMCPICGILFETFLPKMYFTDHVNSHFTD